MKKILKRISLGVLGFAMIVGATFCFTACGDKTPQTPPQNPPYVDPIDPTDPTTPGDEDPTNPSQPGDEDPTNPEQPEEKDPTDPSQPEDDEKDEEKYFALAEIGEALEEKLGFEVYTLYEYTNPNNQNKYLSFIGKNDNKVSNIITDVSANEHSILNLSSLDEAKAKEEGEYFVNAIKNILKTTELKKYYETQGKYTTESLSEEDKTMANNIFNVLLADQTNTLGNYEILYGTISDTYGGGMDTQLGDYLNIQVNATVLNKSNGNIYNYSNVVSVMKNLSANPHSSILQQGGYKESNEKLESIAENAVTKEYQQSVKDKAEYDASKTKTASAATYNVFYKTDEGEKKVIYTFKAQDERTL